MAREKGEKEEEPVQSRSQAVKSLTAQNIMKTNPVQGIAPTSQKANLWHLQWNERVEMFVIKIMWLLEAFFYHATQNVSIYW